MFQDTYGELRPGFPAPELKIEFFAFANVNNTIRLREGRLLVRLSDLLAGAQDTSGSTDARAQTAAFPARAFLRPRRNLRGIEYAILSWADGSSAHELEPDQNPTHSRAL